MLASVKARTRSVEANLHRAATYHVLTGKASLGETLDNERYPSIQPKTFREFLKARKA
tara:strand:+ start:190 stop:363 length:174 start_codon:yes stop_codon:yes gene_type:complete